MFAVSLVLRTLDGPLCDQVSVGTHFLWHCANAVVLFIVSYAVVRRWHATPFSRRAAPRRAPAQLTAARRPAMKSATSGAGRPVGAARLSTDSRRAAIAPGASNVPARGNPLTVTRVPDARTR